MKNGRQDRIAETLTETLTNDEEFMSKSIMVNN